MPLAIITYEEFWWKTSPNFTCAFANVSRKWCPKEGNLNDSFSVDFHMNLPRCKCNPQIASANFEIEDSNLNHNFKLHVICLFVMLQDFVISGQSESCFKKVSNHTPLPEGTWNCTIDLQHTRASLGFEERGCIFQLKSIKSAYMYTCRCKFFELSWYFSKTVGANAPTAPTLTTTLA